MIDSSHLHEQLEPIAGLELTVHCLIPPDSEDARADAATPIQPVRVVDHDPGAN